MVDNTITISVEELECLQKTLILQNSLCLIHHHTSFNSASDALAMIAEEAIC